MPKILVVTNLTTRYQTTVPTDVLQVGGGVWLDCAFVYALDSTTIGVSGQEVPEWKEDACFNEAIPIQKGKENIVLQIPERFSRFYGIGHMHRL